MATVESTFRILDDASRTLRDVRSEAEKTDRALLRMGASGDLASKQVGGGQSQSNYGNAERGLQRVEQQASKTERSFGMLQNRFVQIGAALLALAPVVVQSAGVLGQWAASLVQAVGGAGVIGGGMLGAFAVGLGSVFAVMKTSMTDIKASQQAFTAYNQAVSLYGANSRQAATEAAKLNLALKQAPANTLALLMTVKQLGVEWDHVTAKSRGAIVGLLAYGAEQLKSSLPSIASSIVNPSTAAFSAAGQSFIDRLFNPDSLRIMSSLAGGFQRMIGPLADTLANLGQAVGHLMVIALPFAEEFSKRLDDWSKRFLLSSGDVDYFRSRFADFVSQFRVWTGFFGATLRFISTFADYARGGGKEIHGITDALNQWSQWMRDNPARVEAFFGRSSQMAGDLGRALKFVWDLFAGLSSTLNPTWLLLRSLLISIGQPLLKLLLAVTSTLSIISNSFAALGSSGGALAITLNLLAKLVQGFNWLLVHVPLLGTMLSGGLLILGLVKMVTAIGGFVSGVGKSVAGMVGLTAETDAATAATERLAAVQRTVGVGGLGGLGGGVVASNGVYRSRYPSTAVPYGNPALDEVPMVTPKGGFGLSTGGEFLTGAEGAAGGTLLARAGLGARLASLGEAANPYGIAALVGSSALTLVPNGYLPGGARTKSVLGDVATGAGIGALGGVIGGPLGIGASALVGGAAGLGYGLYQHAFHGSTTDTRVQDVVAGSLTGGHMEVQGLRGTRGLPGHVTQTRSALVGQHRSGGLTSQLAEYGGATPKTAAQYAGEIMVLDQALKAISGDQSKQAKTLRGEIEGNLDSLKKMQGVVDRAATQQQFNLAKQMEVAIGKGAGLIDKRQGPAATLDFVREQVLQRWGSLGDQGKKVLGAAVVTWAQEMEKQNPKLKSQFDKILDGPIGAMVKLNGSLVKINGVVQANTKTTFDHLKALMETPFEQAAEQSKTNLTAVQANMIKLYEAYGYTASEANAIVNGSAGSVQSPLSMTLSHNPAIQAAQAGNMEPILTPKKHAQGGRIGGTGFEDTVHVGGGNMAAPGELIVNHHTENLVNRMLGGRATLGGLVGSEGRPHNTFATGGRLDFTGIDAAPLSLDELLGIIKVPKAAQATGKSTTGAPALGSGHITGTGNSAANQRMAQAMMGQYGWGSDQWSALQALWTGESGWSQYAYNASSGAQGIPQFLPMPGRATPSGFPSNGPVDAAAQLRWGMSYIAGRYGNPSTAYGDWLGRSPHWYGEGGDFVATHPQVIGVGEKGKERVTITPMSKMPSFSKGGGGGIHLIVKIGSIDASGGDPTAVKDMVVGQIREAIAEVAGELDRLGHFSEEELTHG